MSNEVIEQRNLETQACPSTKGFYGPIYLDATVPSSGSSMPSFKPLENSDRHLKTLIRHLKTLIRHLKTLTLSPENSDRHLKTLTSSFKPSGSPTSRFWCFGVLGLCRFWGSGLVPGAEVPG